MSIKKETIKDFDSVAYAANTPNKLYLGNIKHREHVMATIGYRDPGLMEKSRVISLMRIHAEPRNEEIINIDNFARGVYISLLRALNNDGTEVHFGSSWSEVKATLK